MRLDPAYLQYITKDELRVLTAVEMGMRNHQYVPQHLVEKISHLKRANAYNVLRSLQKNKLIVYETRGVNGYKLTYMGYDYLALYVFMKRGSIKEVIGKFGVGKESDIYTALSNDGEVVILKFARLGRISFRTIRNNRDYLKNKQNFNWLYLSRIASVKEYGFMEQLYKNGFPTPRPIDSNRHGIVMSKIDGSSLFQVRIIESEDTKRKLYLQALELIKKFASYGLIHSDFNEHNLMLDADDNLRVIDFPQMISTSHFNADFYYTRDAECIFRYFLKKHCFEDLQIQNSFPFFKDIEVIKNLDAEIKASGFMLRELKKGQQELEILENYNKLVSQLEGTEHKGSDDSLSIDEEDDQVMNDIESDFELDEEFGDIQPIEQLENNDDEGENNDFDDEDDDDEYDDDEYDEQMPEKKEYLSKEDYKKFKQEQKEKIRTKKREKKMKSEEYIKKVLQKSEHKITYKVNRNQPKKKEKINYDY